MNVSAASRAILASNPSCKADNQEMILRSDRIHLLLTMKHTPRIKRILRFRLPHSLRAATDTVCLIVKDTEGRNYDKTGRHWRDLLREQGIPLNGVQILPLRELTVCYMSHEAKRQLVCSHDWFLADQRIAASLAQQAGAHGIWSVPCAYSPTHQPGSE